MREAELAQVKETFDSCKSDGELRRLHAEMGSSSSLEDVEHASPCSAGPLRIFEIAPAFAANDDVAMLKAYARVKAVQDSCQHGFVNAFCRRSTILIRSESLP